MVALSGERGFLHIAQQLVHFFPIEPPARADRAMTGSGRQHAVEAFLQRKSLLPSSEFFGQILDQLLTVWLAERGRGATGRPVAFMRPGRFLAIK